MCHICQMLTSPKLNIVTVPLGKVAVSSTDAAAPFGNYGPYPGIPGGPPDASAKAHSSEVGFLPLSRRHLVDRISPSSATAI